MMKYIFTILLMMIFAGCNSQQKEDKEVQKSQEKKKQPVEKSEVHREYDEFGNLIKYDSIYMWSYSNKEGDSIDVNLDSIMDSFRFHFEKMVPFRGRDHFRYFPKQDSLFMHDFFEEDYYFRHWKNNQDDLESMMRKMDSMRNKYLKEMHPGLMESQGKKPEKKI